jgi:hypothetical protein
VTLKSGRCFVLLLTTARACGSFSNACNFADRFPRIVEAIAGLPVWSCFIDCEAIAVDGNDSICCRRWVG